MLIKRWMAAVILCLLVPYPFGALNAQEADMAETKTPEELELERVTNLQKIAEAELAEAQAKKSLRELDYPETEFTGLDGTTTLDEGAGYYAEQLAYVALSEATDSMSGDIKQSTQGKAVIVTTNFQIATEFALWSIVKGRLENADLMLNATIDLYSDANGNPSLNDDEAVLEALSVAPAVLGAVGDIAKFFKRDTRIGVRKVEIGENALITAAASSLKAHSSPSKIVLQGVTFGKMGVLVAATADTMKLLEDARAHKRKLKETISPELVELAKKRKQLRDAKAKLKKEKDSAKQDALKREIEQLEFQEEQLKRIEVAWNAASKRFDTVTKSASDLIDSLTSRPDKGKSILETIAAVDTLKAYIEPASSTQDSGGSSGGSAPQEPAAVILIVELSSVGGEYETTKRVFRSTKLTYLGGLALSYLLLDSNGELLHADVVRMTRTAQYTNQLK